MAGGAAPAGLPASQPMNYTPDVPATPTAGGVSGPGAVPPAGQQGPVEDPGLWGGLKHILGNTVTDFLQLMGDTPEERAKNLQEFTKTMGMIQQMSQGLGQSSLLQRIGAKRGAEMVSQHSAMAGAARDLNPTPNITPEMAISLLQSVGQTPGNISAATGRDIRR